jgi:hypothetical protein
MPLNRDELLTLVRRLLSPGLSAAERLAVANRLRREARDPDLIEHLFRLDAPLTPEEIVEAIACARCEHLRVPSLN